MDADTIVVGGGIAGLACAWRLHSRGVAVLVLEAQDRAGGNVRTETVDGFRMERGPHTFMASADDIFCLAEEVGVAGDAVPTRPTAEDRFIARGGELHAIPTGPWSFVTSRLLSLRAKLTLCTEPLRTGRGEPTDTAAQFFARRFGPEAARVLAGAFISGVYAGDPEKLSAPAAFPLFWGFEQESGSMVRGAMKYYRRRKVERLKAFGPGAVARKGLYSFRNGLGQLSAAVAARLGDRCRTGSPVRALGRESGGFAVCIDGATLNAPRVVVAVPPDEASRLLSPVDAALGELVSAIPMAPVAVAHLGFAARADRVPDGFGFLAPRGEGVRTLGVLFPSRLFEGRAPGGGDLLAGFVGGVTDPGALALDDGAIGAMVRGDLERLVGLEAEPSLQRIARYPRAIPQLVLGHLERIATIRTILARVPGLFLAGNYLRGVGMKDAVGSGFDTAREVLSRDGTGRSGP
ncbi:MAG: protoporphyrinogen oxidase [Candidatus Riflebacteria bacterium]|nr:protoporphyrinogen oxidase [Candidatus Riflebacteria bacterium]